MASGSPQAGSSDLEGVLAALASFSPSQDLTRRIAELEHGFASRTRDQAAEEGIDGSLVTAALALKRLAGRINDIVHAAGILVSLPYILMCDEVIESLSLAAGNTGRPFDLETDRQIAEFKFIEWRGGPESVRQNGLFIDLFNLATAESTKRRVIYVVGDQVPLRFLNNRRAIASVLSRNSGIEHRFRELYGERFSTVRDYFITIRDRVEIVDLAGLVPEFKVVAS
jgi:hypothetical protein